MTPSWYFTRIRFLLVVELSLLLRPLLPVVHQLQLLKKRRKRRKRRRRLVFALPTHDFNADIDCELVY
jgi:cytochrome c biogenesis protein ResB